MLTQQELGKNSGTHRNSQHISAACVLVSSFVRLLLFITFAVQLHSFFFCMFPIAHCAHPKQTSVCSWHWLSTYSPPQLHCWFLLPSSMGNCSGYVAVAEGGYEFSEEENQTLKTVKKVPPGACAPTIENTFQSRLDPPPYTW